MSPQEFAINVTALLAITAVITVIESIIPLVPKPAAPHDRATANFGLTALTFLINWAFVSAAAILTMFTGPRLMMGMGLYVPLQIVVSVIALDPSSDTWHTWHFSLFRHCGASTPFTTVTRSWT